MAQKNFMGRIALKRDVEATWHGVAQNFVPLDGEMILYKPDKGHNYYRYKIGDGTTTIVNLPFQFDYEKIENEFKPIQGVVISPETSNSYADAFIDTIAQDKDGKITATKKKVGNATITISPGTKLTTGGNFTTNQSTNETITLNHETTTRSNTTNSETVSHGGSFNVIDTISSDATGHITAVNTKTVTLPQSCLHHITSDKFTTTAGNNTSGSYLAAKWAVANVDGITVPYEGMAITFKVPLAGNNGGILLSIDGGTTYYPVVRNVNSLITTHYGVGSTLMLIFNATQTASPYTTSGTTQTITGCWQIADYDSTDKKSSGTSNKVGTKMYIVGGISQSSSGVTTYTNKNCYIGTDNNLYSNNAKVATESYVSGNYKTIQTAVNSPAAAGSATAFIDSISQDTNGKITVSKKNITAAALGLDRAMSFLGTTTTALTDGATTNPITINSGSTTAAKGDVVIVSGTDQEFIWTGSAWEEFGNASSHSIKGHTHTVTHNPAGTISKTSITPAGTVSQPTFSGSAVNSGENTGTNFSAAPGGHKHSVTAAGTVSQPTFTGTEATITISHTPAGTVSQPTFTGTAVTSGKPDTTNVTTIYSITGVGSLPSASLSAGTAPSHTYTAPSLTASIANKCMTFSWSAGAHSFSAGTYPTLTFSAGSLPTRSSAISMPNTNHTHSVTAAGTVSQPTFTGSSVSGSTKYTPAGTVSQPTFTGSAVNSGANTGTNTSVAPAKHKHSVTAAGTVSQPTFTGTAAEHSHTFTGTSATITTSGSSN